ncbi:DMT family transporter [Roseateles koreensis]|uniref:DMT family transporter n=1 Tax=Roseateles koreensis TaxID=2987526 RepID=A0ABT5KRZ8_9BURK|nr:DMT family transporter [Roseateles koreensis]MDC8785210.1 DMT family transporter [Roseateles koreensis]
MMILITLLWSSAGVVTRHLEAARGFELTFWRSSFNALALMLALRWMRGPGLWRQLLRAPRLVYLSGVCWAVMFTAFMLALSLTTVANVLVTMALGPLLTALLSRVFLHHHLPRRTWGAIAVASLGIAWMFAHEVLGQGAPLSGGLGIGVALGVPVAAAVNWSVLQHVGHGDGAGTAQAHDMLPAIFIGALISAMAVLPLAWPLRTTTHDLVLLAGLGVFQLALPCLLVVRLSRVLAGPEIALLGQLEVVFGVLWAWVWAAEVPSTAALWGGAMVLSALIVNELLAWRSEPRF